MSKILFVDDDQLFTRILAQHFPRNKIYFAHNALEARHLLHCQGAVDIVITDFQMPGEDGLSLARFIHQNFPQTIIFMVSSLIETRMPSYIYRFIPKPVNFQDFAQAIRAVEKT